MSFCYESHSLKNVSETIELRASEGVEFFWGRNCIQVRYKRRKEGEETKSSVHLAVVVSCVCEDFLCQARVTVAMLLIVKGWLKWVKMETWSQSGRCLVTK